MADDDGNAAGGGAGVALGHNPDVREALQWIVATYGMPVAADLKRVEWLLGDLCRTRQRENRLLLNAAREGVPAELLSPKASLLPAELLVSRLSLHLEENLLVTHHVARWAVESWALALGRITSDELTTQELNAPRARTPVKPPTPPVKPDLPPDPVIADKPEEDHSAPVVAAPILDGGSATDPYRGWNWSAFFLGWIWLFGHKLWRWGIASFLVCFVICVLSQWYVPFLHQYNAFYEWEMSLGALLSDHTDNILGTSFTPEIFGFPIVEYAVVLLTFVPIGLFGNTLVRQQTANRDFPGESVRERRWQLWGLATLLLGPLLFRVENGVMDRIIETFFPT